MSLSFVSLYQFCPQCTVSHMCIVSLFFCRTFGVESRLVFKPHQPLYSDCKKYPPPPPPTLAPPSRVDWNVQLPGETPVKRKYSETSRIQSVVCLRRNHRRHLHLPFRWKFTAVHWRAASSTSYVEETQRKGNLNSWIFAGTRLTPAWNNSIR